jgi:CubicO group peptidase (beta-lactamase class C family)
MTMDGRVARMAGALALAAIACVAGPLSGAEGPQQEPSATRLALFDRYIEALRQRGRIPGLSAAIVHQQRIIWEKGYGYQDLERRIAARPDTPYRIASLTKTFASTLLMQCVERGALDLDAPISRYGALIPEPSATIRHVMSHTSQAPPGSSFRYSGDRYLALTAVVDSCSGRPFRQALATEVLDPLAMRDSVPGQDLEQPSPGAAALFDAATLARYVDVIARLAKPYMLDARGRTVAADYPPRGISASAGLISTVRDLAKYDAAIDRHFLVSAETQQLAWTPFVSTAARPQPHALGWFVQQYRGTRLVWHYGYWAQFSALYLKVPERGLTLILLANSGELSSPFPLGAGDVTKSAFAQTFLRMFIDP